MAYAKDEKHPESLRILDELAISSPVYKENPITLFNYALNYYKMENMVAVENYLPLGPGTVREDKLNNLRTF